MNKKLIKALRKVVGRSDAVHSLFSALYLLLGNKKYLPGIEKAFERSDLNDGHFDPELQMLANDLQNLSRKLRR